MSLVAPFASLHQLGCIQTGADVHENVFAAAKKFGPLYAALYQATHGNPCCGCPGFNNGKCRAYLAFNTDAQRPTKLPATVASNSDKYPGMSVKQIAAKLGVSMSEVRRRKHAGSL